MMKHRIPDSFIQELLARVDLVDLIDSYVPLKKAGANYQACCPFHNEKTPSFTVSPTKQFYHCFGCGAHGTAFGFLMDYQGLGFIDAVHTLAMRVGLQVPVTQDADPAATSTSGDLLPIMADALGYYRDQLKKSARAIDYLKRRGLTGEIAAHFKLGYAPEGWQNLAAAFPGYANDKALQSVGLVIDSDQGRRYDRFRDRIIFPIINPRNEVIGFGGRILDKGEPKYINSPESPLFEKGRELFGLPQARNAIRKENTIIVVEGYMDVISLAQKGIENCVATLGTATTTEQVHKLLRQADQVIFCFDGDAAGRKAAWRALDNALPTLSDQKRIGFIFLPSTDDPDSLVRREGKNAFFELVRHAIPLSNHLLHELGEQHSIATAEGRSALVMAAKPLLQKLQASVLRLQIVKRLAETVRMNPDEIERVCELRAPTRVMPAKTTRPAPSLLHRLSILVLDQPRRILSIRPSDLPAGSEESAALLRIRAIVERQPDISSAALLAVLGDDPWSSGLAKELLQQPSAQNDCSSENHPDEIEFNSILDKLVGQTRLRAFAELQEKIKARGMTELSIDEKQEYLNLLSAIGKRHNIDNGTDQPLDL